MSRMSTDGEITAMRASGVSSRKVVAPVLSFAVFGMLVTATASLWLTPYSISKTYRILNQLVAAELTAEVQPRVFEEQFPNSVLYVGDVIPGRGHSLAQCIYGRSTAARGARGTDRSAAIPPVYGGFGCYRRSGRRPQSHPALDAERQHARGRQRLQRSTSTRPRREAPRLLEATKPNEVHVKEYTEMDTVPLYRIAYKNRTWSSDKKIAARIELHQRFALPPACILLALIGIPLGVSTRKGRQVHGVRADGRCWRSCTRWA